MILGFVSALYCGNVVSLRYSYSNSYGTGIAIGQNGSWIDGDVVLEEGISEIKYIFDSEKSGSVGDINVVLWLDDVVIENYTKYMNKEHSKKVYLNTTGICGIHEIKLRVYKEYDCVTGDNNATREIYVNCSIPTPPVNNTTNTTTNSTNTSSNTTNTTPNSVTKKSSSPNIVEYEGCVPNWECEGWGECDQNVMNRVCYDTNNCDFKYNKPIESMYCEKEVIKQSNVQEQKDSGWIFIITPILLIILLLLVLLVRLGE